MRNTDEREYRITGERLTVVGSGVRYSGRRYWFALDVSIFRGRSLARTRRDFVLDESTTINSYGTLRRIGDGESDDPRVIRAGVHTLFLSYIRRNSKETTISLAHGAMHEAWLPRCWTALLFSARARAQIVQHQTEEKSAVGKLFGVSHWGKRKK